MTVKIDGTNTEANPAFTGADTDTGLQCGTNELKLVTGGTAQATVDSSGRLLVGKSSEANLSTLSLQGRSDGSANHPILRMDIDNATPSSGATLAKVFFGTSSDTGNVRAAEIAVARHGGTWTANSSCPGRLMFLTSADGASTPTERMRIGSDGQISLYSAESSARTTIANSGTSGGSSAFDIKNNATSTTTGTQVFSIRENGDIYTSGNTAVQSLSSERRLKENIEVIDPATAWTTIKNTPYYSYNYIGQEGPRYGPIVDEVPADMVRDTDLSDDQGPIRTFDNGLLQARLYSALQEAIAKIETLETQNTAQQAQIDDLLARVTALEAAS